MSQSLKTFIIYARADAAFKDELLLQLNSLVKKDLIKKWDDTHLLPGEEWEKRIMQELEASDLVIMIVSAHSLYSDFIQKKELKTALQQKRAGITRVIPILVRDCLWEEEEELASLQMLPRNPNGHVTPVAAWTDPHSAWAAACRELIKLVNEIRDKITALAEIAAKELAEQTAAAERAALEALEAAAETARQKANAEKEKKNNQRREQQDEAAWKTTLAEVEATSDVAEKIAVFEAYLDVPAHTAHTEAADAQILQLKAEQHRLRIAAKKTEDARRRAEAEAEAARLAVIEAEKRKKEAEAARLAVLEAEKRKKEEAARLAITEAEKREKEVEAARLTAIEAEKKRRPKNGDNLRDAPNLPEMVFVEGGTFKMGRPVTLSDYYIGKYPVTFDEYEVFCTETKRTKPADNGWGGGKRPVINVNHDDAIAYCTWIAQKTGKEYRLPTEAEWEFAARGGTASKGFIYAGNNDLKKVGWYTVNSGSKTQPVGTKKANELGIYDMSGNVWERCSDWYAAYPSESQSNPTGPASGVRRVLRSGSWGNYAENCRAAYRHYGGPTARYSNVGFRLARSL